MSDDLVLSKDALLQVLATDGPLESVNATPDAIAVFLEWGQVLNPRFFHGLTP
jgi:hypothetical protein